MLTVSSFEISLNRLPASFDGFRIVHLSDLHGAQYGPENDRLRRLILDQSPDLIAATGDMLDRGKRHRQVFVELAKKLVPSVPVYSIRGNHEQYMTTRAVERSDLVQYEQRLRDAGVKLLDNAVASFHKGADELLIYGITLPVFCYKPQAAHHPSTCLPPEMVAQHIGTVDAARCTILLAHSPLFFSSYASWGADLVLAGHMHGGMIRLPGIGGLLSPYRRLFPSYDAGVYFQQDTAMVVSRGLGDGHFIPRIGNPPEVVVVTLRAAEQAENQIE